MAVRYIGYDPSFFWVSPGVGVAQEVGVPESLKSEGDAGRVRYYDNRKWFEVLTLAKCRGRISHSWITRTFQLQIKQQ